MADMELVDNWQGLFAGFVEGSRIAIGAEDNTIEVIIDEERVAESNPVGQGLILPLVYLSNPAQGG